MASKLRVEFMRLSNRDANGIQGREWGDGSVAVTKAVSGTALTTTGKIDVPAKLGGYSKFHARLISDVDVVVTAGPDPEDTSLDATLTHERGVLVLANTEMFLPVEGGWVMSAITGPFA